MRHTRIIVTRYGGPDELRVVEEECPEPKDDEVRVRVLAAGVAYPDLLMREGVHPEKPPLPFTLGRDLIGVVDRLGKGVSGIEPGQTIAALPISGAYAQFVCLPQRELVPVPSGLDAAEAVSLVLNYITAYQMMHRSAQVRPGRDCRIGFIGISHRQIQNAFEALPEKYRNSPGSLIPMSEVVSALKNCATAMRIHSAAKSTASASCATLSGICSSSLVW